MKDDQGRINYIHSIWQAIRWRMNERRITPEELALKTGYSKDHVERGLVGEPIPITKMFLNRAAMAFGLTSGRAKYYEDTTEILTYEELVDLIMPKPAMPPRQGDFWNYL